MTALAAGAGLSRRPRAVRLEDLGELVPVSRAGGQGRVYRPQFAPRSLSPGPVVVKLYRHGPADEAVGVLSDMVAWARSLPSDQQVALHHVAAWPLAVVHTGEVAAGIVMRDVSPRFSVPFVMPSGRRDRVLLTLEHLLGGDGYLELRGLGVRLATARRAEVAERISDGLAFLHRHGIAVSDIAPNNLLVAFGAAGGAETAFIDCDSMSFRGRNALPCVQTADWDLPAAFGEPPGTRAADAYKLGLVILRLFARSHDARVPAAHLRYVPVDLRDLLYRSLSADAVNRPAAGEWQRALRGLLADGRLNARYPGPAPTPVISPSVDARVARAPAPARAAPPAAAAPAPVSPAAQPVASPWLRRVAVVLWLVGGTVVLALVLSRLFAAAIPGPGGDGGSPAPYQYQYQYQYRYYGYPGGGQAPGPAQGPQLP